MAKTDKQRLEFVASILADWDPEGTDTEILYAFGILDEIPKSKYKKQWDNVRKALNSNPAIDDPWLKEGVRDVNLARQGRWWWNPDEW